MQESICLPQEQFGELVHALRAERAHLLLIGGSSADYAALLSELESGLDHAFPIVNGDDEAQALAHVRHWLARLKQTSPRDQGWCADDATDVMRCAVVLDSPSRQSIEHSRKQLGDEVQFVLTLTEAPEPQLLAELLSMLDDRVLEVRLDPPVTATPFLSPPIAHRLEVAIVGVILVLVGLSTLWLADSAVSEPSQRTMPAPAWSVPVWSVRP